MRRYKFLRYSLIIIGLYIFWSFIFLPVGAAHTPVCGGCHTPSRAYQTAEFSEHPNTGCLACHRNPGLAGNLLADLRGVRNLGASFSQTPPEEHFVDNDACLECHDKIMDDVIIRKGIRMSHREVIDGGWRCGECHGNTGHSLGGVKGALQNPSMDKCFGCHLAQARLDRCALCHAAAIKKGTPKTVATLGSAAHTNGWNSGGHGSAPQDSCPVCHAPDFCKSCHRVSLPHNKTDWPLKHDAAALANGQVCTQCHQPSLCSGCHGTAMPHPAGFNQGHTSRKLSKDQVQACYNCHLNYQCEGCHRAHKTHGVGG